MTDRKHGLERTRRRAVGEHREDANTASPMKFHDVTAMVTDRTHHAVEVVVEQPYGGGRIETRRELREVVQVGHQDRGVDQLRRPRPGSVLRRICSADAAAEIGVQDSVERLEGGVSLQDNGEQRRNFTEPIEIAVPEAMRLPW